MINDKLMYGGIALIMIIGGFALIFSPSQHSPTSGAVFSNYNKCVDANSGLKNNDIYCRCIFADIHTEEDCKQFTKKDFERNDYEFCMKGNYEWVDQGNFAECWKLLK